MAISDFFKRMMLAGALSIENGRISVMGKYNIVFVEADSLAYLYQKVIEEIGEEKTEKILLEACKIAMEKVFKIFNIPTIEDLQDIKPLKNLESFLDIYGLGKVEIKNVFRDEKSGNIILDIIIKNSPILEFSKNVFNGKSRVCILYKVNLYVWAKLFTNREVIVEEIKCHSKGDEVEEFKVAII
ncbi:MAG: hypothetical protein QXS69_01725 [Candidatus Aenigmatarchaeota archaeon]